MEDLSYFFNLFVWMFLLLGQHSEVIWAGKSSKDFKIRAGIRKVRNAAISSHCRMPGQAPGPVPGKMIMLQR